MTETNTPARKAREERLQRERLADVAERAMRERKAGEKGRVYLRGLRRVMKETGTSSTFVALCCGVSQWSVCAYATCRNTCSRQTAEAIARTLGTTVEDLEEGCKAREERLRKEREVDAAERAMWEKRARGKGRIYLRGLRREAKEAGVSLSHIARSVGASRNTAWRYAECTRTCTREDAELIARTLGTTVEELEEG